MDSSKRRGADVRHQCVAQVEGVDCAERGIVGFLLLAAVLVLSARTLWRQCPAVDAVMASALLAAWMTAALAESQSSQGVPTLLLCFVVARAAIPHIRSSR